MVYGYIVQCRSPAGDLSKVTAAVVRGAIDILEYVVVDTVAAAIRRSAAGIGENISDLESIAHVHHPVVADGHVSDTAKRADIGCLIFWSQQHCKSPLSESTPTVLHNVAFEQHPLRVLQFEIILDDEGMTVSASDKVGTVRLPVHRPEFLSAGPARL